MTAPLMRRERIARLEKIGWVANLAAGQLRGVEPGAIPAEIGERLQAFADAARDVAAMAAREIAFLEESRDWAEGDAA